MSRGRLRSWSLVGVGVIVGLSISYGLTAYAFRDNHGPIPLEEIREFTEVFGAIKANYVERTVIPNTSVDQLRQLSHRTNEPKARGNHSNESF